MASFGHIAVGLAAGRACTPRGQSPVKAMAAFSLLSMWPDLDVVGFSLGVPYAAPFGHRGATHSSLVALSIGGAIYAYLHFRKRAPDSAKVSLYAAAVAVSHGLLDTMTFGGGLGVALLWPFSNHRFWAPSPFRLIPIAPIGAALFTRIGFAIMAVEVVIFSPFWIYAVWPRRLRPA